MQISSDQVAMMTIDVLRHGQSASLMGIVRRLNNTGCIGWRHTRNRDFTLGEVVERVERLAARKLVRLYVLDGPPGQWSARSRLTGDMISSPEETFVELTESAWKLWEQWRPQTN